MRWRFADSPAELALRNETLLRIDAWWSEFTRKSQALNDLFKNRAKWDLPSWMHQHLNAIHPEFMWEFGLSQTGTGHRLVITPENHHELRPLLATLLERAPRLEGWEFYPYRPPESLQLAIDTVRARTGGNVAGTLFTAAVGRFNRLDLCFASPATTSADDKQAFDNAFVAAETLLGEECLDTWIGAVEVAPLPKPGFLGKLLGRGSGATTRFLPLDRLFPTVNAVIDSIQNQLPPVSYCQAATGVAEDDRVCSMLKLEPQQADDYAGHNDLMFARVCNTALFEAQLSDALFDSRRFSRSGETFLYLKIDRDEHFDPHNLEHRERFESALNNALRPQRLGITTSVGTGLRYSYVDLAVTDLDRALPLIRATLQSAGIPRRSWLLFFDAPLADEWLGFHPDTPAPPTRWHDRIS